LGFLLKEAEGDLFCFSPEKTPASAFKGK